MLYSSSNVVPSGSAGVGDTLAGQRQPTIVVVTESFPWVSVTVNVLAYFAISAWSVSELRSIEMSQTSSTILASTVKAGY